MLGKQQSEARMKAKNAAEIAKRQKLFSNASYMSQRYMRNVEEVEDLLSNQTINEQNFTVNQSSDRGFSFLPAIVSSGRK